MTETMNASMRLVTVMFLLLGCTPYSSSDPDADPGPEPVPVEDGAPGPVDELVGVWEGSGSSRSDSDVYGGQNIREFKGSVTISRLSSAVVQLDPRNFDGFDCGIVLYDVSADLQGKLRRDQRCWAANMVVKSNVMTLSGIPTFYNQTTYSTSATLKPVR
jgi:hypothetical protein